MKKYLSLLILLAIGTTMQAQNPECSKLFYQYYEFFQKDNLKEAYPIWREVLNKDCEDYEYYENILTDGEGILDYMAENATSKADSIQYGKEYVKIIEQRRKLNPNKKLYWDSEIAYQKDKFGLATPLQTYRTLNDIFIKAKEFDSALSAGSATSFYSAAAKLNQQEVIDFKEFLNAYSNIQKVVKRNVEIRDLEFNDLQAKADSAKLSRDEKAKKDELRGFADYFKSLEEYFAGSMSEFMTCDNLGQFYAADLEANKDSLEWLNTAVYTLNELVDGGCASTDSLYYPKINDAFVTAYYKANPDQVPSNETTNDGQVKVVKRKSNPATDAYFNKQYRKSIPLLKDLINKTSGSSKGNYAYYLADAYGKVGSKTNALAWFKKAAQYKPGWAAPYTAIARIYGNKATINSCGKSNTQKSAAYLVAADYMKKACRYNKSLCKYVSQYERAGPTANDMFNDGFKPGQKIRITCFGGASTTLR